MAAKEHFRKQWADEINVNIRIHFRAMQIEESTIQNIG